MALRTPLSVTPHLYMGDSTGRPLDMGTVYFGEQDKDPEFYPINLFSDDALTKPLAQPVHTKGGYLYDKGDMVEPHAKELIYSVKVLDSYGRKVFYKGAMMRNSWNDDVIEQINAAIIGSADVARQVATDITNEAINNTAIDGGVLADTFVTVTANGVGAIPRTQRDKNRDTVSIKDFGVVGDGVADDTARIQAAINATPIGGTLYFTPGTYLLDTSMSVKKSSDLDNNWTYGALIIDKPMRIVGNKKAALKLKNFSTAWANQDVGDSIGALIVNASNVHIDGLNIDGNGNNHYETFGGFKYWEAGESLKRPPCGIIVTAEVEQPNVEDVLIENCNITDTLAGVYFYGNALDTKRAQFLDNSLKTGVVKNCTSRNNTFRYLRGNGVLFNMGADNCISDGDKFVNCMYHSVRIYSRAINCRAVNGRSIVNCDDVIARYNETDNGYWRTNNPASSWIKIIRSGFHIGGAGSYSADNGYSVYNCGFDTCTFVYNRPKTVNYDTYFEKSSLYIGAFTSTGLPNCYIKSCVSVGADYGVVLYNEAGLPSTTEGVCATGNKIVKSNIGDIYIRDVHNASATHNHITVNPDITYPSAYLQNFVNGLYAHNTFTGSPMSGTYGVIVAGDATNLSLKDNDFSSEFIMGRRYAIESGSTPICMYPKRTVGLVNAEVIEGGSLSDGWKVAYPSPAEGQENNIRVLNDGTFNMSLRLSALEATGIAVGTLTEGLRPFTTVGFAAVDLDTGAAYSGRILTDGRIQITIPVSSEGVKPTQVYAEISYNVKN